MVKVNSSVVMVEVNSSVAMVDVNSSVAMVEIIPLLQWLRNFLRCNG